MHDIIDNSNIKLADVLKEKLTVSKRARFAVGWLFLSGLKALQKEIDSLDSLEILAGSKTNRETSELLLLSKRYDKIVSDTFAAQKFLPQQEIDKILQAEFDELWQHVSTLEPTEENMTFVKWLWERLRQGKIKIHIYPKETLHAKLYLFEFRDTRHGSGTAYVGSSNISMSGFGLNTELNVAVHGEQNHKALSSWFDKCWKDSQACDFTVLAQKALEKSWPMNTEVTPFRVYLRVLHEMFSFEEEKELPQANYGEVELHDFQKDAVSDAYHRLNEFGGVFLADVPGLGKTYMGSALLAHLQEDGKKALVICPPKLIPQWNDVLGEFGVGTARVFSNGKLSDIINDERLMRRDIVLIDEAHHFRNEDTNRYKDMEIIAENKQVILVGATPQNLGIGDLYHQIKLFTPSEINHKFRIDPPSLKEFFKACEEGNRSIEDLISQIVIRRVRKNIIEDYPSEKLNFPERIGPKRVEYSIEEVYKGGVYKKIGEIINNLKFARYDIGSYIKDGEFTKDQQQRIKQAGKNLKKLIRIVLFRRLESSIVAFRDSSKIMHKSHQIFLKALAEGKVLAGESADDVIDQIRSGTDLDDVVIPEEVYPISKFHGDDLIKAIKADEVVVEEMAGLVKDITPDEDDKLQVLKKLLKNEVKGKKTIVFTQFSSTAKYLGEQLAKEFKSVEYVSQDTGNVLTKAKRFSPKSNKFKVEPGQEINILVSTELLSEGLNLQDGQVVINYELHWNPVRIIQRIGRIDRIGSTHDKIWVYNFFPEEEAEKEINVEGKVTARIEQIIKNYGADEKTVSMDEKEIIKKLYEIYTEDKRALEDIEEESKSFYFQRQWVKLQREFPDEYKQALDLPAMVNCGHACDKKGIAAFLRTDDYFRLMLANESGSIISRNDWQILKQLECGVKADSKDLLPNHLDVIKKVKEVFENEANIRENKRSQYKEKIKYQIERKLKWAKRGKNKRTKQEIDLLIDILNQAALSAQQKRELRKLRSKYGLTAEEFSEQLRAIIENATPEIRQPAQRKYAEIVISESLI